jgi:serine protease Do
MMRREHSRRIASILQGVVVWGILPDTPAAEAGVRSGDIILSVNGTRTRTLDEYLAAKNRSGDIVQLVVFRDGDQIAIEWTRAGAAEDPGAEAEEVPPAERRFAN